MAEHSVGDVVDRRYRLRREIARGGVGVVFEAEHIVVGCGVAIKFLNDALVRNDEARSRLLLEARALGATRHPNVVAVLDAGHTSGDELPYLVMELLEGRALDGILAARGTLAFAETLWIGTRLLNALAFVHERGIVHRDVKPGNLILARDAMGEEIVKLVDFGAAQDASHAGRKITQQGGVIGTPEYMAPEQLLGSDVIDARADVYACGVLLYECFAGVVPFEGTYGEVLLKVMAGSSPHLGDHCPDLPAAVCGVIEKALARDRADRWSSARGFRRALHEAIGFDPAPTSLLDLTPRHDHARPGTSKQTLPLASPPTTISQRRRFVRAPYVTPVEIVRGSRVIMGRSEDISEGGLLVTTGEPCSYKELVRVRFALPNSGCFVQCEVVARWMHSGRRVGAQGLEFRELPDDVRATIREYVTAMVGSSRD